MKFNIKEKLRKYVPNYTYHLVRRFLPKDCESVLDIGCGRDSAVKFLDTKIFKVGVDVYKPDIDVSRAKKIHNKYLLINVEDIDRYFKNDSFDCVLAIGLVEHLRKKNALILINKMEKIAKKIVMIETPSGFVNQTEVGGNSYQKHLCGFETIEFEKMGYRVLGKDALRSIRVDGGGIWKEYQLYYGYSCHFSRAFL